MGTPIANVRSRRWRCGDEPVALTFVTTLPRWPGWRHLPRETRDILFLLGVIAWTVLPHLAHLPWWCGALTAVVLVWRGSLAVANAPLPGRWAVIAVLLLAAGLTWFTHRTLLGKDAGVTLLVVLMVLKTLELRLRRDAVVVFFLGFFLVLTNFLYSQSLAVAAAMLVSVWGLLTALVLAHMPVGQPSLKRAGALAARAGVLGAPLMLALFLLFPRFGPLWGLPSDALPRTGLSNTLRLGGVAEIANDDSVAMRLRFEDGAPPPQHALYFRGPVLSHFDGKEWHRREFTMAQARLRTEGAPRRYEITLEPSRLPFLPLLDATAEAPRMEGWRFLQRPDLQWQAERPLAERLRLEATAWTAFSHGPLEPAYELQAELQLPAGSNPRTVAWARALRERLPGADAEGLAGALYRHVREAGFGYTLAPGTYGEPDGANAIDDFWLGRKQGFCEHFAASFVLAMRAMGVPARIVTGYQGADRELQDGWLVVRQSHAHAWAEYWQRGRGWVRADPTAAVAPDRIERSAALAPPPGLVAGTLGAMSPALVARLRLLWERVDNRWNQWVLNYSRGDQFDLLSRLGVGSPNWADLALLLIGLLSGTALLGAGWALYDRHRQDPWQRLQARVRRRLTEMGIAAAPHEPLRTLATRVRAGLAERGEGVAQALERLDGQRYGPHARRRPDPGWWRAFAGAAASAAR